MTQGRGLGTALLAASARPAYVLEANHSSTGHGDFDASSQESSSVRQTITNRQLPALDLLNDVTLLEAARVLAQHVMVEGGAKPEVSRPPFLSDGCARVILRFDIRGDRKEISGLVRINSCRLQAGL